MADTSDTEAPAIVLFRDDLRLSDNPALQAGVATGRPLLCLFVFDEASPDIRPLGGAARWWLHHSLRDLSDRISQAGGRLDIVTGASAAIVPGIAEATGAAACFWNRRYGKGERAADAAMAAALKAQGLESASFNGSLLHEPHQVRTKTGGAFRVYTPFLRASLALGSGGRPLPPPRAIASGPRVTAAVDLDDLALLPTLDWAAGLRATWTPGEPAAQARLRDFLDGGLPRYGEDRNRPALDATSHLSPHLRHGEISPRQIAAQSAHAAAAGTAAQHEVDKFLSELIWRDFSYNLLVEHPDLAWTPVQPAYARFPYRKPTPAEVGAWRKGLTGYPIVDAGMRQLWTTGVMHNRVRMITASFLIKHMLVDWREGEAWFWDTLCDADPANNPGNWQWVAGCGADAAPYFRIFNPVLQGEKFDGKGDYIRAFVPELAGMPPKWVHKPWEAPPDVLDAAGVTLGESYPRPIVEHEVARARALDALASLRR